MGHSEQKMSSFFPPRKSALNARCTFLASDATPVSCLRGRGARRVALCGAGRRPGDESAHAEAGCLRRPAYVNFGYCVLGRVIEAVARKPYHEFVAETVLAPLGIRGMRLGRNLLKDRAPDEVRYYDSNRRTGRAISGPEIGKQVPLPYGVECIETMDANGGWIASAADLLRFAVALDDPAKCRILNQQSILAMLAPPPRPVGHTAAGKPKAVYYGCGWQVRPAPRGEYTKWHTGGLAGSSTLLVCRADGIDWAVLFNCDADRQGKAFADLIDPLLHKPADEIKDWPDGDLFPRF